MEGYYKAVQQVEKCKSDCLKKYPEGSSKHGVLIDKHVLVDVT